MAARFKHGSCPKDQWSEAVWKTSDSNATSPGEIVGSPGHSGGRGWAGDGALPCSYQGRKLPEFLPDK